MAIRYVDDESGEVIADNAGIEVHIYTANASTAQVRHYATWAAIPRSLLAGTIEGGPAVALVMFRDRSMPMPRRREARPLPQNPPPPPPVPPRNGPDRGPL